MKHTRIFLMAALLLTLTITGALAACPVGCDLCTDEGCSACDLCTAATATARPCTTLCQPVVTAKPVILSTPAPQKPQTATPRPIATQKPAATATTKPSVPPVSNGDYTTFSVSKQEEIVFELLNRDRAQNGLPALVLDPELSRIARIKSQDMKDNHYFAHESPTYGRAAQMLTHFGYAYNGVGENIAHHSTVEKAQAAFLSSTSHRANIMGKQWQKVGIGVVYDDQGFVYVTQLFVR